MVFWFGIFLLLASPVWAGARTAVNLFDGLSGGSLTDGQFGWSRSEKDDDDGDLPNWWVKYQTPENAPPYLEIFQDVWNNGRNMTITRDLRLDPGLRNWQLTGRMKVVNAMEDSIFLRIGDDDGHAVASFDRFTLNHQQGKHGPGDSYLNFNGVSLLPKSPTGKAKWNAIMQLTTTDWKPFQIAWSQEKPAVLTLQYGDRMVEAPVPEGAQPANIQTLQVFFGWGLGAQGKGSILLEGLTISSEKAPEKSARR